MSFVRFEEMNELQRRLHNVAIVLECECNEHGFVDLLRETIGEIEAMRKQNAKTEADATRYRWLREQPMYPMWKAIAAAHGVEQRDSVIDDWMKTPNGGGKRSDD